ALWGLGLAVLAGGGFAAWTYGAPFVAANKDRAGALAVDAGARLGLKLENLTVEGRVLTPREDLLSAIDADRGTPILAIDVARARAEIEKLPWVRAAKVERHLPDTVNVEIEERKAYALWQQGKRYTLVDR